MNEQDLKGILARNPQVSARDNQTLRPILAKEPEHRTSHAPDGDSVGNSQGKTSTFVCFIFRRVHLLDGDAIAGSGKDLLDGLQDAGLIPGDRENEIDFEAIQQKVGKRREEGTWIYVATGTEAERLKKAKAEYRNTLLLTLTQ